ncbi:hypothetical protein [Paenibacillus sp. MBLB4367]|uniref:hypothetical protein n=1 Tax=Paenibacillus sp. MBLB4367 TaxID=3384767 RepID=UPI003907E850
MKSKCIPFLLCSLLLLTLSACSNGAESQGQDPSKVMVEMVTEPTPILAKQQAKITVQVTGLIKQEGAKVQLDIRKTSNSLPDLISAEPDGKGGFTVEKTFDKQGTYTVYVHVYRGELHITKKKQFEVT